MCLGGGGAVVLAAATLSAFIIICRLAFDPLATGRRTLRFWPWGSKRFKADHRAGPRVSLLSPSVLALVPRWVLPVPTCANVSVSCQIPSPSLFDV